MTSYIWITKWDRFQHYKPERDQAPVWIKTYTKQHDDDNYRALTNSQRALLHDLRIGFARARGRLATEPLNLSRRFSSRVTHHDLNALNHAGFIEFISIDSLEERLDEFYTRIRSRSRERTPQPPADAGGNGEHIPKKELRRYTGCKHTRGTHGTGYKHDPLGIDRPPPDWPYDKPTLEEVLAAQARTVVPVPHDDELDW